MNYRTKVNAVAGGLVAVGFGGVPGALLGGGLAGYLEGRDVFDSTLAGATVALVAIAGLWLWGLFETIVLGGSLPTGGEVTGLFLVSLHVAFWATVGGGIGGYLNRETGI